MDLASLSPLKKETETEEVVESTPPKAQEEKVESDGKRKFSGNKDKRRKFRGVELEPEVPPDTPSAPQQHQQHHQHHHHSTSENEEAEELAHRLSLVDVMLSLQKEVFKQEFDHKSKADVAEEDLPGFIEENPGCWIFGHGDIVDLPHEFSNPTLVSRFCGSLLGLMFCCTLFRLFWISLIIFVEAIHTYLYTAEFYAYPLMVCFFLHIALSVFTHLQMTRKLLYITPLNLITFLFGELNFTAFQVFLSLGIERGVQLWYVNLDLYEDFKNEGYDAKKPEFWTNLRLTPGIALVLGNLQIALNIVCAFVMDVYTTSRVGTAAMYRMLAGQTLMSTLLSLLVVQSFSYRVSNVWDTFQVCVAGCWAVFSSLLFVHYLERILLGQTLRLRGMRWADICYAALRTVFV